jgi:UDP-glucose 4-epimerase
MKMFIASVYHKVLSFTAGYNVVALDNFTNSVQGLKDESVALQRVEEITGKTIKFFKCDLLDVGLLTEIFNNHKIVSVIHFAAMKAVGESMVFPLQYYKNNLIGMINLLEVY